MASTNNNSNGEEEDIDAFTLFEYGDDVCPICLNPFFPYWIDDEGHNDENVADINPNYENYMKFKPRGSTQPCCGRTRACIECDSAKIKECQEIEAKMLSGNPNVFRELLRDESAKYVAKYINQCPLCRTMLPKDANDAFEFVFRRATKEKSTCAITSVAKSLGIFYRYGVGPTVEDRKRLKVFHQGNENSKDLAKSSLKYFEQASELGDPTAQYRLGMEYAGMGRYEIVNKDLKKAEHYLKLAAKQQHGDAWYRLANVYAETGKCLPEQIRCLKYAVKCRNHKACGTLIMKMGVNSRDAERYATLGVSLGDFNSARFLQKKNAGNPVLSLQFCLKAAELGSRHAQWDYGETLFRRVVEEGLSTFSMLSHRDLIQAYHWMKIGYYGGPYTSTYSLLDFGQSVDSPVNKNVLNKIEENLFSKEICWACTSSTPQIPTSPSRLLKCSRCKVARYCRKTCQQKHWVQGGHKTACCVPIDLAKLKPTALADA